MNLETRYDAAALLLRLGLGTLFLAHGLYLKVFVFTVPGTVAFFESIGYPGFAAHLVIGAETLGGLALILGLHARWASLALLPVLLGAWQVHAGNGWLFTAEGGGWEYPAFWTLVLAVQAVLGDGRLSLSHYLGRGAERGRTATLADGPAAALSRSA